MIQSLATRLGPRHSLTVQAQTLAPIPSLDSPVVDTTGTLDAAQKQALVQQALDLQQRKLVKRTEEGEWLATDNGR